MKTHQLYLLTVLFLLLPYVSEAQPKAEKPRTIVTTDGEIDDVDSFIRMLLYANEFRLEGLVYSSSMWHYKGDGKGTKFTSEMEMTRKIYGEKTDLRWPGVTWMQDLIDAYEQVYPTLSSHAGGYPAPDYLRGLIKVGNIDFEGEMEKVTEGSEFIKNRLLDDAPGPIYLQAWGGTNTIARALKSIEDEYENKNNWADIQKKVAEKAIIYTIMDQDATIRKYISIHWPDIRIYYNASLFWCLAYGWKTAVPEQLHPYFEGKFMSEKIINHHGPLTRKYYSYGDGQQQPGDDEHIHGDINRLKNTQWGSFQQYDFISEGDSPAFLHLINVGLDNLEHPEYGGWGGRLVPSKTIPGRWEDGEAVAEFNPFTHKMDPLYSQLRWLQALQLDFSARADWCVKSFQQANHPPVVRVKGGTQRQAAPGKKLKIKVLASDPDGGRVGCTFWQYAEAGTCQQMASIERKGSDQAVVTIPHNARKGDTIHLIVEGRDGGEPALTRYQRVVITVK